MATNLITQTGNRVQVLFNSLKVGLLQNVRFSMDTGLTPASGIGDAEAQEYVPGMVRYTASFSKMTLINETMRSAGLVPPDTTTVLQGIVFDIGVFSLDTGAQLRVYTSASYGSGDISIEANRIVVQNGQYMCLSASGSGM